jgi:hypothetical protein
MEIRSHSKSLFTVMSRSGEYWSEKEEMKMLQLLHNEKSMKEVAEELKRTKTAVKARLYQFAYELWREDICVEDVVTVTTLDELHVRLAIESKTGKPLARYLIVWIFIVHVNIVFICKASGGHSLVKVNSDTDKKSD